MTVSIKCRRRGERERERGEGAKAEIEREAEVEVETGGGVGAGVAVEIEKGEEERIRAGMRRSAGRPRREEKVLSLPDLQMRESRGEVASTGDMMRGEKMEAQL